MRSESTARETRDEHASRSRHVPHNEARNVASIGANCAASGSKQPASIGADDAALIARAQAGDVPAFAQLYDRHAPKVLALARFLLNSAADSDDLLHDVFLEAWQAVRDYDPSRASVVTWLLMRTRSRARDRIARRVREQRALCQARPLTDRIQPPAHDGLAMRGALDALDVPVRTAIELMYVAGMTAGEISARTHVPEGTVRSRVARGLALLEDALG